MKKRFVSKNPRHMTGGGLSAMRSLFVPSAFVFVLALFLALGVVSCDNMSSGGADYAPVSVPAEGPSATTPEASHKTVILSGSLSSGAVPRAIAKSVNSNIAQDSDSEQALIARSANPSIDGADYYYYVKTLCQETGEEKEFDQGDPIFIEGASSIAFELALLTDYTWVIECGFKKTGLADPVLFDKTAPIHLDETDSVVNVSFAAKPNSGANGGYGSVLLLLSGSYKSASVACSDDGWIAASGGKTTALDVDEATGAATLNFPSIKAGAYEVAFSFYNDDGVMVYQTVQTISVLAGMETNSWISSGGDEGVVINSDHMFQVGAAAISSFDRKTFYVGKVVEGTTASNSNAGSAYAPFETLDAAANAIAARGSNTVDYNIYISGTVQNDCNLHAIDSAKAKSVTISGVNGGTLKAKTSGQPVLNVMSTAPLHLRNIAIDGEGAASEGVIVNPASAGGLYIEDGTVITGCKRGVSVSSGKTLYLNGGSITQNVGTDDGAGVYVTSGATLCMRGGTISQNETSTKGAGVYCTNGSVLLYGGTIQGNKAASDSDVGFDGSGGGVYLAGSSSLDMSGGKILQNQATAFGGGVYAEKSSLFAATGGEILQNTAPAQHNNGSAGDNIQPGGGAIYAVAGTIYSIGDAVYIPYGDKNGGKGAGKNDIGLGSTSSWKSPVTVASQLVRHASSDPIALTPNWKRGNPIVKSDDKNLTAASQEKFTLTADMNEGWEYIYTEDEKTIKIDAPFYVGSYNGTLGSDSNDGTKTSPFRTLAKACQQMNDGGAEYTIRIIGSTYKSGDPNGSVAQEIPSTLTSANAKSVMISGYGDNAKIQRGADGYVLKISSAVPVTLNNVTVTGGHNSQNGGGIIVDPDAVLCLGKGVKVIENVSDKYGGGIYTKGKVFIYADAKIGERKAENAENENKYIASNSYRSNYAQRGAGIYIDTATSSAGEVYLGYKRNGAGNPEKDDDFSGGIYYNYSSIYGGAVMTNGASADKKGKLTMCGGTMAYNSSTSGGAVYNTGALELNGGTIQENKASSNGGAVCVVESFASADFNGPILIPYGDGSKKNPYNDVWVTRTKQLTLGSNISLADSSKKIKLTPETESGYSFKKRNILTGTLTSATMGCFDLNAPGFKLDTTVASGYATLVLKNIVTTIYVASTADSGDNRTGSKGEDPTASAVLDSTWNNSTHEYNGSANNSAKPFATIAKAAQFITYQETPSDYTIYVDGTLVGAQSLANSSDSSFPVTLGNTTATKITLASKNGLDASLNPKDILNGSGNRTLNINASVPIHILALEITGGSTGDEGGGIRIATPGTSLSVTLGDGTDANGPKIDGNHAHIGGGVYFGANTSLTITKGARICENFADQGSLASRQGGGVYNAGTRLEMSDGEISGNKCNSTASNIDGGGVYNTSVFVMTGGTIKGNSAKQGGGICNAQGTFYMSGSAVIGKGDATSAVDADTVGANYASDNMGGGGIYNYKGALYIGYELKNGSPAPAALSGGVIGNYAEKRGGGIYCYDGSLYVAAGKISCNKCVIQGGGISCNTYSSFNASTDTLELDGSTYNIKIEKNEIKDFKYPGGAIDFWCKYFKIKGNVSIPSTGGVIGFNDIKIDNTVDRHIEVTGALASNTAKINVDVVTPANPSNKYKILTVSSGSGQTVQNVFTRFDVNNAHAYLDSQGYVQEGYVISNFIDSGNNFTEDIPDGSTLVLDSGYSTDLIFLSRSIKTNSPKKYKVDLTRESNSLLIELDSDDESRSFEGCTNITEVAFNGGNLVLGKNAFKGCSNLETVKIINEARPYGYTGNGYNSWNTSAFDGCSKLTTFDFTGCTDVDLYAGCMFSGNNTTVKTVKLGTVLKNLSFSYMERFANSNFKLTYDGSSSDLKTKVTTTQSNYSTDKEITCDCSDGVSLKWKQSTGSWQ
ncbi:MAG: leucine-rich repeat protein [Treponema sp.]|nr:leucine-rich repeat protein [Treponema sp.]